MSRADFEQAVGEIFGDCICPPVPFDDASAHECCEVVTAEFGDDVSPADFVDIGDAVVVRLAAAFGRYFEAVPPSAEQIREAIRLVTQRWPAGSLQE